MFFIDINQVVAQFEICLDKWRGCNKTWRK